MKATFIPKIFFLLFLAYSCPSTEGLECYDCVYVTGMPAGVTFPPGMNIGESCKPGSTPDPAFVKACTIDDPEIPMTCGRVHTKVKLPASEIEITARSCVAKPENLNPGCQTFTVEDLAKIPNLPEQIKQIIALLPQDTSADICSCNEDRCTNDGGLPTDPTAPTVSTGPTESGPTVSGPTESGPTESGPTVSGPTESGPTESGPTVSGPTESGPTSPGPTDRTTESSSTVLKIAQNMLLYSFITQLVLNLF